MFDPISRGITVAGFASATFLVQFWVRLVSKRSRRLQDKKRALTGRCDEDNSHWATLSPCRTWAGAGRNGSPSFSLYSFSWSTSSRFRTSPPSCSQDEPETATWNLQFGAAHTNQRNDQSQWYGPDLCSETVDHAHSGTDPGVNYSLSRFHLRLVPVLKPFRLRFRRSAFGIREWVPCPSCHHLLEFSLAWPLSSSIPRPACSPNGRARIRGPWGTLNTDDAGKFSVANRDVLVCLWVRFFVLFSSPSLNLDPFTD